MNQSAIKKVFYRGSNCISFTDFGNPEGYPILVQHGMIASIKDCSLFDRLIRFGSRLICIARPGYGESTPYLMKNYAEWGEIISILVDQLGLSTFDVLGMSSGAPYSYAIGCRFPNRIRNIFIFSGIPALYNEEILFQWPYDVAKNASIEEMQKLAHELFFCNVTEKELAQDDIHDSMMNDCFGVAQDMRLRGPDWGFSLSDIIPRVFIRHSKADKAVPFLTAEMTARLLPNCHFEAGDDDAHFSVELLDDFIKTMIIPHLPDKC